MNSQALLKSLLLLILTAITAEPILCFGKPRPPSPPWPEVGSLHYESFDVPYSMPDGSKIDSNLWSESWSGYALNRTQQTVQHPFVVPMANPGTNLSVNIDPERGAIRIWYQPGWSSAFTGLGSGPGEMARLLTLSCTNGSMSQDVWSLIVAPDGNALDIVSETDSGPTVRLTTPINWEAGSWHLLAVGYTPTNSALFVDGQMVATGDPLPSLPLEAIHYTSLVVGSDMAGHNTARGQFEQLATFTGRNRFSSTHGHPFGMGATWDMEFYYSVLSPGTTLGPITKDEEEVKRAQVAALRAERLKSQEAALLSGALQLDGTLDGGFQTESYDPELPFWLLSPEIDGTNVLLTIANADTNLSYDILQTPQIEIPTWNIVSTGAIGQIQFYVPMMGVSGFYRGVQGQDWDGDGIPNWMDASSFDANVGALVITIESPLHNSTIY